MGGFNYENNKNNPNISNNSEQFGACSVFLKEFKIGMRPILKHLPRGKPAKNRAEPLHQRLMSLFSKIRSLDRNSPPGCLNVSDGLRTNKGKLLLREFVFTPKAGIRQRFGNPQLKEEDFSVFWDDFDPSTTIFPKGATHFDFLYLVLAYEPEKNLFTTYSAVPIRRSKKDGPERLVMRPEKGVIKKEGMQYILAAGLRFMEILGDEEYASLGQDGMGVEILGVF